MKIEEIDDAVYRNFATVYPHECYDNDSERFWRFFHDKYPDLTQEEMINLLDKTRK